MIHFRCSCGNILFFDNSICLQCERTVGYDPVSNRFHPCGAEEEYRLCGNGVRHGVCNWVLPSTSGEDLCLSCQLTRTLPNLGINGHLDAWNRMEAEKRRTLYTICRLGLAPQSISKDPTGLAFDFLAPQPGQPVMTGHADGVITINILEADDAYRERQRCNLHEPYRTLLGHFRHEIGHYYWDRFFRALPEESPELAELRELFGDDRLDYGQALARHYEQGAPAGWADQFITAYASTHPWEDWAETWAQYLHIIDAVETSIAFGWRGESVPIPFTPFTKDVLAAFQSPSDAKFLQMLNTWVKISPALNEMGTSLGRRNLYPFVLNSTTARKIHFVHHSIENASGHVKKASSTALAASAKDQSEEPKAQVA